MGPRPEVFRFRRVAVGVIVAMAAFVGLRLSAQEESVFSGPVASYEMPPPRLAPVGDEAPSGLLRWLFVEERVGESRHDAPVRVPLFFTAGECHDVAELSLVRWPSGEVLAWQADDVRRGPDGGLARVHLWFATELTRGETQRFAVIKKTSSAPPAVVVSVEATGDKIAVAAGDTLATFRQVAATRQWALTTLNTKAGPALEFPDGLRPELKLGRGGTKPSEPPPARGRVDLVSATWGTGPVFAKVVSEQAGPAGTTIAQVWRVFHDGHLTLSQTVSRPDGLNGVVLSAQDFGRGKWRGDETLKVQAESASLLDSLQDVHRGYVVDALVAPGESRGWLSVPGSIGGTAGRLKLDANGEFRWRAQGNLAPGTGDAKPDSVRALWSEVSLIPVELEAGHVTRAAVRAAGQPLVAVVERPGLTAAIACARIADNVREMKPVGWANEAIVKFLNGKASPFAPRKLTREADPEFWITEARKAELKVTGGKDRPLTEPEKGRAAGALDPYHITYETGGVLPWVSEGTLPPPLLNSLRARLTAVQRHLGRVDESGWPYLDVFARTQNMQMGPPLLALADRGLDPAVRRFYRDQLAAPTVAAVMMRGMRPYQGRSQAGVDESDALYQSVVDFMLRASELTLNQSLGFQPVALGRYLDAIDVNADLYHPARTRIRPGEPEDFPRANFFRLQSHLHRWLGWGPSPFIALLRPAETNNAIVPGATEAWHRADGLAGAWKNWPDQSWLYLASVLPRTAQNFRPAARPAEIALESQTPGADGIRLRWKLPPGIESCRVYRLRAGAAPAWLNSPYRAQTQSPMAPAPEEWVDQSGKRGDRYRIHAVDRAGNETAW